jgi:hypothetical protein
MTWMTSSAPTPVDGPRPGSHIEYRVGISQPGPDHLRDFWVRATSNGVAPPQDVIRRGVRHAHQSNVRRHTPGTAHSAVEAPFDATADRETFLATAVHQRGDHMVEHHHAVWHLAAVAAPGGEPGRTSDVRLTRSARRTRPTTARLGMLVAEARTLQAITRTSGIW